MDDGTSDLCLCQKKAEKSELERDESERESDGSKSRPQVTIHTGTKSDYCCGWDGDQNSFLLLSLSLFHWNRSLGLCMCVCVEGSPTAERILEKTEIDENPQTISTMKTHKTCTHTILILNDISTASQVCNE